MYKSHNAAAGRSVTNDLVCSGRKNAWYAGSVCVWGGGVETENGKGAYQV